MTDLDLAKLTSILSEHYDVEDWWPSDSPFEVMIGAVLTQQTTWEKVTEVLSEMRSRGLLEPGPLAECDLNELEKLLRPVGFYRQKGRRIVLLARYVRDVYGSNVESVFEKDVGIVRSELLALEGIGDETADSIILFAGNLPSFVAANYVRRLFNRIGLLDSDDYDEVKGFVETSIPRDHRTYRELYALCVSHCKSKCLARPECHGCPLRSGCDHHLRT